MLIYRYAYQLVQPPSTTKFAPVTKDDAEEAKKRMRESSYRRGKDSPMKGKTHSVKTRELMSANYNGGKPAVKVRCIETGEIFDSVSEASNKVKGAVKQALRLGCRAGGFHWERVGT